MMPVVWIAPSLVQPAGLQRAISWSHFADRVEHARSGQSKESLARWAPVEFRGARRCLAGVLRAHAAVLDVDDGSALDLVLLALDGFYVIAHSTFSATAECPRWRVIVPLDWPVDASEYDRVWRWLAAKLEAAGVRPDYGARDASRAWAVPARPPSGFYVAHVADGAFASSSEALKAIPEPAPLPEPERTHDDSDEHRLERASKYLERMPGAISGSGGHSATFKAACVLMRGFGLPADVALQLLVDEYNPRCAPPWSLPELRHKVRQAYQRSRLPFGFLVNKGRAA
jgi:hypothetical protein